MFEAPYTVKLLYNIKFPYRPWAFDSFGSNDIEVMNDMSTK